MELATKRKKIKPSSGKTGQKSKIKPYNALAKFVLTCRHSLRLRKEKLLCTVHGRKSCNIPCTEGKAVIYRAWKEKS